MDKLTAIIAARIPGPFRTLEQGAAYQETAESKAGHLVPHYRARRARGIGARAALEAVLKLPAAYRPGGRYSSPRAAPGPVLGSAWKAPGRSESLRWAESTSALGLRFIGWADELIKLDYTGWFTREDGWTGETLRGAVWQWPGGRVVYGYCEMDSRERETNPGSAALALDDVLAADPAEVREHDSPRDWEAVRDAARWADGIAERVAEDQRDYDSAYQAGAAIARDLEEAEAARAEALELLAEMKAERGREVNRPAICGALRARLDSILEGIRKARAARLKAWADVGSWAESAWRDGYAEEAGCAGWNRFARPLRLSRFAGEAGDGLLPVS